MTDLVLVSAHVWFAILATLRLTELVTIDRLSAPLRERWPHYLWTCGRCVSVWAGGVATLLYLTVPWANWPLALSWVLIVSWDWRYLRRAVLDEPPAAALRTLGGGIAQKRTMNDC